MEIREIADDFVHKQTATKCNIQYAPRISSP